VLPNQFAALASLRLRVLLIQFVKIKRDAAHLLTDRSTEAADQTPNGQWRFVAHENAPC
jgi:hypothetical protein